MPKLRLGHSPPTGPKPTPTPPPQPTLNSSPTSCTVAVIPRPWPRPRRRGGHPAACRHLQGEGRPRGNPNSPPPSSLALPFLSTREPPRIDRRRPSLPWPTGTTGHVGVSMGLLVDDWFIEALQFVGKPP